MVAPKDKLKNIFLGSSYNGMFSGEDEINSLYSKAANSYFRSGQWTDGINATISDLNLKVVAFHDQAKHPVVVHSEAGHAFIVIVMMIVIAVAFFIVLFLVIRAMARRKEDRLQTEGAQQIAIRARNSATDSFMAMPKDNSAYATYASKYANLSGSMNSDPTTNGLSAETYQGMAADWRAFEDGILRAIGVKRSDPTPPVSSSVPPNTNSPFVGQGRKHRHDYRPVQQTTPITSYPSTSSTVVVQNSGNDLVTGMVLGEALAEDRRPRYTDPEPYYRPGSSGTGNYPSDSGSSGSDSSWGSSSSSSDDSSSSSGSDSSWGSSDSGSSDSGSSGSDSSW